MTIAEQNTTTTTAAQPSVVSTLPARFEVTTLPVADVDRAKAFYQRLGWRLDIDFKPTPDARGVQFTPPGSQASIQFGQGTTTMKPGSLQGLFLVVDDIEAARADLIGRGVEVSDIWHIEPGKGRAPGVDPQRRSYFSRASFADPDGNTWVLQEITERLPGRVEMHDSGALAQLLFETARRHGQFEAVAPPHDWWDWYGAYMDAREQGSTPEEAAKAAGRYMAEVKHVVVASD
jgi:catechol 2,3-dioxygenase-like lactoylglutathione lyase family enzyme